MSTPHKITNTINSSVYATTTWQLVQHSLPEKRKRCSSEDEVEREILYYDAEINTELTWVAINEMENKLNEVTKQLV